MCIKKTAVDACLELENTELAFLFIFKQNFLRTIRSFTGKRTRKRLPISPKLIMSTKNCCYTMDGTSRIQKLAAVFHVCEI